MKKFVALLVVAIMSLSLIACSKDEPKKVNLNPTESTTPTKEEVKDKVDEVTPTEDVVNPTTDETMVDTETTPVETETEDTPIPTEETENPNPIDVEVEPDEDEDEDDEADNETLMEISRILALADETSKSYEGCYSNVEVKMDFDVPFDISEYTGQESSAETLQNLVMVGTMKVYGNENILCGINNFDVNFMGMEQTTKTETWCVKNEDGTYTQYLYDEGYDKYIKSITNLNQYSNYTNIQDFIKMDGLSDLNITENDTEYTITGNIDMNKLSQVDTSLLDSVGMNKDIDIKCALAISISKETYLPTLVSLDFTKQKISGVEIKKGLFVITYNGFTEDDGSLVIPDDVIDNSIDASDMYNTDFANS